jgi:hypothetical protein
MRPLELPGVLTARELRASAEHVASLQLSDGLIPWLEGQHGDPWDHVEGAMALNVAGLHAEARRAFRWSAEHQAPDGSWPMETVGTTVRDASADTNQVAYLAVGLWHDWLLTGCRARVDELWPVVRRAIEFAVSLQQPGGALAWSRDPQGRVNTDALLTGSACVVLSLRCGMALAELVGDPQPDWEIAAARLAHAVAVHPQGFADKSEFSMDWYYPVLGGAVTGAAGRWLIDSRWDDFVVPGRGIRCVSNRPWVTAAETAELVLTLDTLGDHDRAWTLMRDVQFLRADGGGYWTGWVWPDDAFWPGEQSSWTAAAIVLAADALARHSPAEALFRGDGLPGVLTLVACDDCLVSTGGS